MEALAAEGKPLWLVAETLGTGGGLACAPPAPWFAGGWGGACCGAGLLRLGLLRRRFEHLVELTGQIFLSWLGWRRVRLRERRGG